MPERLDMLAALGTARPANETVGWRRAEAVSYEVFRRRLNAWRALAARAAGQSFALYCDDSIEFAAALFGAWQAGKTIYLPGDILPQTCADLRLKVDGYWGDFPALWQPQVPTQESADPMPAIDRLGADFIGLVLHTSGTTGSAQAIPKKLAQLDAEVAGLEAQFGALLGDADIIATVSHQHIYGLLFKVLWPLTARRAIHAASFSIFGELFDVLARRDCALVSSPAHLQRLPQNLTPGRKPLRAIFSSGGPLAFETARRCTQLTGQPPIEIYGSSETGGIAWRRQANSSEDAWTPFSGVHWRINPIHEVLEIRSPYLASSDWFATADRAQAEGDNRFLLRGRVDRIAKIEGKRVSLTAIESQLVASPLVAAARVIVLEGSRQRVAAFIVPSESGRERLAELGRWRFSRGLRDLLVDSIEPVALPRIWRYPDTLPVNAQGKTTIAELKGLLDRDNYRPTEPRKRLVDKNSYRAIFEIAAPRNLLYFDGHFPGRPILPGVVQIDWVIACGRQCFDLPPLFRGVHALKFQRVIPPETPVRLEIAYDRSKSVLSFQITSPLGRHAAGRILFEARDV